MHDHWLRMLRTTSRRSLYGTTEEHKVLRPIKRAEMHESHTVTEKGPSRGKIGSTEPRDVEGMNKNSRCASEEKTWVQSEKKKLHEDWDAISLVFLSAILRDNFGIFWITFHHFWAMLYYHTYGNDHSYQAKVKCKIGYDGGLITWISAKPTDRTPEVNYYTSWILAENSIHCGERRALCCPGFNRLVLLSYIIIAGIWTFYFVSSNITKW